MMSFSKEWNEAYSAGRAGNIWPWSDLVSYVMRYARPVKTPYRVLELGPGIGANIPFFEYLGAEYYGIEGSASAVHRLQQRFSKFSGHIVVGDFTMSIPFDATFDLIVDRSSLTHNTTKAIQNCIKLLQKSLAPGAFFIGVDWFSMKHSDFQSMGSEAGDPNTKEQFSSGQFKDVGKTHFTDRKHIEFLFKDFSILKLDHKIVIEEIPSKNYTFASWNFVAKKND